MAHGPGRLVSFPCGWVGVVHVSVSAGCIDQVQCALCCYMKNRRVCDLHSVYAQLLEWHLDAVYADKRAGEG